MLRYNYKCPEHGIIDMVVEYEDRDKDQSCPVCGAPSPRTWEGHTVNPPRASYVDGRSKRFDNIRKDQMLRKAKAGARAAGDIKTADKIEAERKKVNKKG